MSQWGGEAIHDAILSGIASAPTGKKINSVNITLNADGTIDVIQFYGAGGVLLFTLTFAYSGASSITITRS
jgi:hypothetical protein